MNDMLRTLTRRSFVSSRLRNVIAVLAIAITAVLFTSVTTIMFGTIQSSSGGIDLLFSKSWNHAAESK